MTRAFLVLFLSTLIAFGVSVAGAQEVGETAIFPSSHFLAYPITNIKEVLEGKLPRYADVACEVPSDTKLKIVHDWRKDRSEVCRDRPLSACLVVEFTFPEPWRGLMSCPRKDGKIWSAISECHWNYYKKRVGACP